MKRYFNGKFGLTTTYWVGVWGVGILSRGIFAIINRGYLTSQGDAEFARIEVIHNAILIALSIYMILMVRAMVLAGFNNRRPGGWGWTGIILTAVGAAYICFMTVTVLFPSVATPKFLLELEIRQINKLLPQDMGDGLGLTRVKIEGDVLVYYYSIDGFIDEEGKQLIEVPFLDTPEGKELCIDFEGYFDGGLTDIRSVFVADNITLQQDLNGAECQEWLKNRE